MVVLVLNGAGLFGEVYCLAGVGNKGPFRVNFPFLALIAASYNLAKHRAC